MKVNIKSLFIERGKTEATSVQLSISNDNLDNSVTPLSLRVMWLASDNVWTVLQGGVFDY